MAPMGDSETWNKYLSIAKLPGIIRGERQMEQCFMYREKRVCLDVIDLVFLAFVALVALALLAVSLKSVPVTVQPLKVLTTTLALKT